MRVVSRSSDRFSDNFSQRPKTGAILLAGLSAQSLFRALHEAFRSHTRACHFSMRWISQVIEAARASVSGRRYHTCRARAAMTRKFMLVGERGIVAEEADACEVVRNLMVAGSGVRADSASSQITSRHGSRQNDCSRICPQR